MKCIVRSVDALQHLFSLLNCLFCQNSNKSALVGIACVISMFNHTDRDVASLPMWNLIQIFDLNRVRQVGTFKREFHH